MPLLWRVFASNAVVLVTAALLLVLSPATVELPGGVDRGGGAGGRARDDAGESTSCCCAARSGPLARLRGFMTEVDPLQPGARAVVEDARPRGR